MKLVHSLPGSGVDVEVARDSANYFKSRARLLTVLRWNATAGMKPVREHVIEYRCALYAPPHAWGASGNACGKHMVVDRTETRCSLYLSGFSFAIARRQC